MAELIIFCIVGFALILAHFAVAVWYKLRTKSKKSVWYIMEVLL